MKKRITTMIVGLCIVGLLAGCGNKEISNDNITITQYKGLEVTIPEYEMSDAEFESMKATDMQTAWREIGIKDRAAANGDTVVIGFEGKMNGKTFEGGTSEEYYLELGSKSFIDGFEEGIVGKKPGEEFDLDLEFPDPYPNNPDFAGKPVVFTVTFHAILPEFSEEFIPALTANKCTTLEEYRKMREEEAAKSYEESLTEEDKEAQLQSAAWETLLEKCVVKSYPQDEVDEYVTSGESYYKQYAQSMGMEYDAFCQTYLRMTAEEFTARLTEDAKKTIAQKYAIELIAEEEKMTISAKLYDEKLAEYAEQAQQEDVKAFEKEVGEKVIKQNILFENVTELIVDSCKVVEDKAETK